MEEELCYSTVNFRAFDSEKAAVRESEDSVLYSEVRRRQSASENPMEISAPEFPLPESVSPAHDSLGEEKAASSSIAPGNRWVTGILGLLTLILFAALTAAIAFNCIRMSDNKILQAQNIKERDANLQLVAQKQELERDNARMTRLSEEMNSTLHYILTRRSFLSQEYCQNSNDGFYCTPCPQNWIQNGSRCYFFYHKDSGWKTWKESEEYCNQYEAHLAEVDTLDEQEFINQYTKYYYDSYHGYWIGLSENTGKNWVWITGATLKEGFWISNPYSGYSYCVLSMFSKTSLQSWKSDRCNMKNRWICELEALTWPTIFQSHQNQSELSG